MGLNRRDRDVLIVGGGLVGASLALALRAAGCSVAVFDRGPIGVTRSLARPDPRVYALSPGSAEFLHALGVWAELPAERIAAIESMRIEGDRPHHAIEFSAYEMGRRALAWMVEHAALQSALDDALRMAEGEGAWLALRGEAALSAIEVDDTGVSLTLAHDERWRGRLLVAADGLDSWVRRRLAMPGELRSYGQSAVVASFACAEAHQGRALQWFLPEGEILALLPQPGRQVSLVWSANTEHAQALLEASPAALEAAVEAASASALGKMQVLGPASAFPLRYLRLDAVIGPRVALLGDAAHGVHPLAGQGVNLGFGDAVALAATLRDRGDIADCGAHTLLQGYARQRMLPVATMQLVTDGLWRLFRGSDPVVARLRNAGLALAGSLLPLRRLLAQPALR